ncbi:MAG: hypothetical protein ACFFF4_11435 [Candidatus Thorarchaeota archaeon]
MVRLPGLERLNSLRRFFFFQIESNGMRGKESRVVKAYLKKTIFPKICPVCSESADSLSRIEINPYATMKSQAAGGSVYDLNFAARRSPTMMRELYPTMSTHFSVPTCSTHKQDKQPFERQMIITLTAMILIIPGVFYLYQYTNYLYLGFDPLPPLAFSLAFFGISGGLILTQYYPTEFQKCFKIIGLSPNGLDVYIKLRNTVYLDKILEMNPMSVETSTKEEFQKEQKDAYRLGS